MAVGSKSLKLRLAAAPIADRKNEKKICSKNVHWSAKNFATLNRMIRSYRVIVQNLNSISINV